MKDVNATVIVNLNISDKKLWKSLQKDARWGIGRARKEGLVVTKSNNESDWKSFYNIYKQTVKKGGGSTFDLEEIKEKSEVFMICKHKGKVIGGATIWFSERYDLKIPRLYVVASDKKYLKMQPNNLIYWECIRWAKDKGYLKFDLGGWQIKAKGHLVGVNTFKERWGEVVIYEKDYPPHVAIGRKAIRNIPLARKIWDKIKKRG